MEGTPDEYHARRAIMRSVADRSMKTVNLEIQKGDESTIIKIETSALRCMDDSYYNPWRMEGIFSPKTNTTPRQSILFKLAQIRMLKASNVGT